MKKIPRKAPRAAEPAATYGEPRVKIADLKANLSRHLRTVRAGGTLTITDRDTPIARVVPVAQRGGGLVVRPATKSGADFARLIQGFKPLKVKTDPVDLIREMRREKI